MLEVLIVRDGETILFSRKWLRVGCRAGSSDQLCAATGRRFMLAVQNLPGSLKNLAAYLKNHEKSSTFLTDTFTASDDSMNSHKKKVICF